MYLNRLKKLRVENNLTQKQISMKINTKLHTYINWERNIVIIPLQKLDELALYYEVSLSYILGISKDYKKEVLKPVNYEKLLNNLLNLKEKKQYSYTSLSMHLKCGRSTLQRYFIGERKIPVDKLIELSEFYKVDLDTLLGKR